MRQVSRSEAQMAHWPILEPIEGERQRPIALNKPVCVAGDRARVNLTLSSPQVSRAHAMFLSDEHSLYVRDLASLNRLQVNDAPVREADLHEGDVVRIGPYAFVCRAAADGNGQTPREPAPPAELQVPDSQTHIPLSGKTVVIGSRDQCDVLIQDGSVGAAHAVVFERDGKHFLRDLRTTGGTFVNDRRIGQVELEPGDTIRIAEAQLRYQPASADDAAAPVAAPAQTHANAEESPGGEPGLPGELDAIPLKQKKNPPQPQPAPRAPAPAAHEPALDTDEQEDLAARLGPSDDDQPDDDDGTIPLLDDSQLAVKAAVAQSQGKTRPDPRHRARLKGAQEDSPDRDPDERPLHRPKRVAAG